MSYKAIAISVIFLPSLIFSQVKSYFTLTPSKSLEEISNDTSIALYYNSNCPNSRNIASFIKQFPIEITIVNVCENLNLKKELLGSVGKLKLPCLMVGSCAIYDSQAIIDKVIELTKDRFGE